MSRMTPDLRKFLPTALSAAVLSLLSTAKWAEYKGTCYFNSRGMPCSVSHNPFTLTMHWSDGVTETYSHQGDVFLQVTDLRGGKKVIYAEPSAPSLLWE